MLKLARKCKNDWKKIAKRLLDGRYNPNFLKRKFKEITEELPSKRINFSKTEDLLITKYYKKYEFDWEKMASHFRRRTPIMLKNRFYAYIRKKDLVDELYQEVVSIEKKGKTIDSIYEDELALHNDDSEEKPCTLYVASNPTKPESKPTTPLTTPKKKEIVVLSGPKNNPEPNYLKALD